MNTSSDTTTKIATTVAIMGAVLAVVVARGSDGVGGYVTTAGVVGLVVVV